MKMDVYVHLIENAEDDVSMFEKLEHDLMAALLHGMQKSARLRDAEAMAAGAPLGAYIAPSFCGTEAWPAVSGTMTLWTREHFEYARQELATAITRISAQRYFI